MTEESKSQEELDDVQAQAQKATENNLDIADQVRDITLQALTKGKLDSERIKSVVKAVVQGVSIGATEKQTEVKNTLKEALIGIDEALAKTAEASKLAIEEATGKVKDYNKEELDGAIKDVKELEDTFFDTVKSVAKTSSSLVKTTLEDLIAHAKNTGTSVGENSKQVVDTLSQQLGQTTRDTVNAGTDAARTLTANIAEAASGFLSGLADSIKPKK